MPAPTIHHGDCLEVIRSLPDASIDAVVTDPPYALSFMGKAWDSHDTPIGFQAWCQLWAVECLRVLKPGGHLLAFGGTRTWHRLACAVEDAGFEVRDSIAWMYGSGFPKSLDVSKAIDKAAPRVGMPAGFAAHLKERRVALGLTQKEIAAHFPSKTGGMTGCVWNWENGANVPTPDQWAILAPMLGIPADMWAELIDRAEAERQITQAEVRSLVSGEHIAFDQRSSTERERRDIPATDDARTWQGWGTALKPAFEPIVVARKPLVGTVAGNVLAHGTGALNIDGCRIGTTDDLGRPESNAGDRGSLMVHDGSHGKESRSDSMFRFTPETQTHPAGRWPANVILDEDQANALDQQSGVLKSGDLTPYTATPGDRVYAHGLDSKERRKEITRKGDSGGASRFFYVAKAPKSERPTVDGTAHPTVKPLALMRWLVRLVTPPGGTVLEPFAGSGTTVEACILEGFNVIAIEREADYLPLIQSRIFRAQAAVAVEPEPDLFSELDGEAS